MESILKQVYGVELASQKVELGLAEDVAKMSASGKQLVDEMNSKLSEMKKADDNIKAAQVMAKKSQDAATKTATNAIKVQANIGTIIDKLDKTAKDLGISASSIPNYKEALAMYDAIDKAYSAINSFTFQN